MASKLYVWTPPYVWAACGHPYHWSAKAYILAVPNIQWGSQTCMGAYGHPNIVVTKHAKYMGCVQAYRGHPNIGDTLTYMGASKHMGVSKHTGRHMGGILTYRGPSKHMGASKYAGDHAKHIRRYPSLWVHPNAWQHMDTLLV